MLRSQTEPSTPLRNIVSVDTNLANYSAPLRSRISAIHLPPQELLQVLSGLSLRRSSVAPEGPSSRKSGNNSRRSSYTRSRPTSQGHTPTRRLSDHLNIRRRRRSSTGIVYDAGYVGPVTKGFLRAFSRALLQEHHVDSPEDEVYKALDEQHQRQLTSPAELTNEFDFSLPLPSDDVMMSPYIPPQVAEAKVKQVPEEKPVFKSYLERILEGKNRRKATLLSMFDRDSPGDMTSTGVSAVINTSKFFIENTLSGLPEYSGALDLLSLDLRLAEPVAFGNHNDESDSSEYSEKENLILTKVTGLRRSSFLDDAIVTPQTLGNLPLGSIDQLDIPRWESVLFDQAKMITPNMDNVPLDDHLNEIGESDLSGDSPQEGFILGHFTIDDDHIQDFDFLQPHQTDDLNEEEVNENNSPQENSFEVQAPVTRKLLANKRQLPTAERGSIPKSLVRGVVSVARGQREHRSPPRKRVRKDRIPPPLMQLIASKSNEFLQQVMLDLEAYAGHRHSDQINIQDAVLYLNRIKSYGPSSSTIDNISVLAQSVFPLELLVSLDNSIQESVNKRLRKRTAKPAHNDDELYDVPPLESERETDSLKLDDNLADLDWEQ